MTEIHALLDERERTHGNFTDNAEAAQAFKATARNHPMWTDKTAVEREAVDNILLKVARFLSSPDGSDSLLDIQGYAALVKWTNT